MNFEIFSKQEDMIENIFATFMEQQGYYVSLNQDESVKYLGYGGLAVHKDDKFSLMFQLNGNLYPRSFSISVKDRNGNFVLMGETVAIYSLSADDNTNYKELSEKFKILLNDVFEKYKIYSKENRLDFVFNNLEMERKSYTDVKLNNDDIELENDDIERE